MKVRQAMVLAAGKGTRLAPLTDRIPKPLCEVAGQPLIRLALRQLADVGVARAVVNVFHLGEAIIAALGDEAEGIALTYSREERILGTGGGIRRALRWLGEDPFYVLNADALQDVDLAALSAEHARSGAMATLALRDDPEVARFGPVGTDETGRIRRLVDAFDDGGGTVLRMFTGVHVMDARCVSHLPDGEESCVIRRGYAHVLRQGGHLHSHVHRGAFHDVGTPPRWAEAQRMVLDGAERSLARHVGGSAGTPAHHVDPRARVALDARVIPPSVVMDGAVVEGGAEVGPYAAVGRGAVVGAGSRVARAALLGGERLAPGGVLEGAVAGAGVRLDWPWP